MIKVHRGLTSIINGETDDYWCARLLQVDLKVMQLFRRRIVGPAEGLNTALRGITKIYLRVNIFLRLPGCSAAYKALFYYNNWFRHFINCVPAKLLTF